MPGDNGFRLDDDQEAFPCRPKPPERNPEYPVLGSQPGARTFSLKHAQLLAQREDLQAPAAAGTEEGAEAGERADE